MSISMVYVTRYDADGVVCFFEARKRCVFNVVL